MKLIKVTDTSGVRLDHYLVDKLEFNRSQITSHIKSGLVLVNGLVTKPGHKLSLNDEIILNFDDIEKNNPLTPQKLDLNILFEDDHIMVINKPKGLVVHPSETYKEATLVSGLLHHTDTLSNLNDDILRPGIVHRIDKDTSGLLLVAKTNEAHLALADDLKNHEIKREYIALVSHVLDHNQGVIDAPIARHPKLRTKMAVVASGKPAVTHFKVIKTYKKHTLLHCKLETGRTHQIRVHLAYIKHPIVGDPLYGLKSQILEDGQLLHAFKIEFVHPINKKAMVFESPLPEAFESYLSHLS
jgi:23S rRNA pseudouridine1911/1915/1917 synthase